MALDLNLYHEVLKAKALKRRDPLKLSMYGIAAIIACCACWYFLQVVKMHGINEELSRVKYEFDQLEPQAKAAKKREDELIAQHRSSEALVTRIEDRFYWAPVLEQVMKIVPRDVQITRMGGELTGEGVRRCSLTLDGLSAGVDPRRVADELRTSLAEKLSQKYKNVTSTFRSLDDGADAAILNGKQVPTATFTIAVVLFSGEEKTAAPATRKKR